MPAATAETAAPTRPAPPLHLQLAPAVDVTDEQFFQLCRQNRDLRLERTSNGEIVFMAPAGGASSNRNAGLTTQLFGWAEEDGTGVVFDSSGGFKLPNGATRAPDAAWVRRERLARLSAEEKETFPPLCPDFIVELRSPSDRVADLQEKMQEYLGNGLRLGWLIDPQEKRVLVYRPGDRPGDRPDANAPEMLEAPDEVRGDPVLPDFALRLRAIWEPQF